MRPPFYLHLILTALLLSACTGTPEISDLGDESPPQAATNPHDSLALSAGASGPVETANFILEGYDDIPQKKAATVEQIFSSFVNQTSLLSFKPANRYRVIIYRDQAEYTQKTGKASWPGVMRAANRIYTYDHFNLEGYVAHEIAHMIFEEFMGGQAYQFAWLNEGLAMCVEAHYQAGRGPNEWVATWLQVVRANKLVTVQELEALRPYSDDSRHTQPWYATSASLVWILLGEGGSFGFGAFLNELKASSNLNGSFQRAYPAKFGSLEDLYQLWKSTYGIVEK